MKELPFIFDMYFYKQDYYGVRFNTSEASPKMCLRAFSGRMRKIQITIMNELSFSCRDQKLEARPIILF